jgi:hypothetical protein
MIKSKPSTKEYRDNYDRTFRGEFNDILVFSPVDPDPIKLDESGNVVVVIKTLDGDIAI